MKDIQFTCKSSTTERLLVLLDQFKTVPEQLKLIVSVQEASNLDTTPHCFKQQEIAAV